MNNHQIRNRLMAGALVAGLVLAVPGVAMAASAPQAGSVTSVSTSSALNPATKNATTFAAAKAYVEGQLTARQQRLSNLTSEVSAASDLTSSDKATLTGDLANETSGIDALVTKVPGDTTWAELLADAKSMVQQYRVFVVMSPQVHETIAADTATAVCTKLQADEPQIEALINYEQSQGKNVTAAQTAYEGLVAQVSAAQSDVSGISAAVLGTSPAGYPGNASIFSNAHSSLIQARTALKTARSDLHTIVQVLGV
jgi:hypothetical protein